MSGVIRYLVVAGGVGIVLLVVGIVVGAPHIGVEGAYFNRGNVPVYVGVFARHGPALPSANDGNLWLGAGVALIVCGIVGLVGSALLARRGRAA